MPMYGYKEKEDESPTVTMPVDKGTPYRCPICTGVGFTHANLPTTGPTIKCHGCNGTGIVWSGVGTN